MYRTKFLAVLVLFNCLSAAAQTGRTNASLTVAVTDENGAAVNSARVVVRSQGQTVAHCETDFAGRCQVAAPSSGSFELDVEKEGFYALREPAAAISGTGSFDVALHHQLEVREQLDVKESTPAIDPAQVVSQQSLSGVDVINMPFPETHDYRNVLNFIPGVINDSSQQPHVSGAETYQTLVLLDGFNVTQPANGELLAHVSTDAFRQISVEPSRESAEYGKASAGVLRLETGIGDDHFRVSATNFVPSFQEANGLRFDQFVPRVTFSGPIRKGRAWFFDGVDGELDNNYVEELPKGQNDGYLWRIGNLAKVQTNLTSNDILTASFLVNYLEDEHAFLGPQTLLSSTPKDLETSYIAALKEQHLFPGGGLLESGFGYTDYNLHLNPYGVEPYFLNPEIAGGNYYLSADQHAKRWQALANLNLAPQTWMGKHDIKMGVDIDHITYDAAYSRTPISYLTDGETLPLGGGGTCLTAPLTANFPCTRYSTFSAAPMHEQPNDEASVYVQDRWLITDRVLLEPGLRFDEDRIVGKPLYSPRLAGTYVPNNSGDTKLSAGVGTMYDETSIYLAARPYAGTREDTFFSVNPECATNPACTPAVLVSGPVKTNFTANTNRLQAPKFLNWSVALDQKLPWAIYARAEFIERHGSRGLVYNTVNGATSGDFVLQNARDDRYDALQITLRRIFRENYNIMGAYTRSRARSNEVLDFNVDSPILSAQRPGPYPWDSPNRFLSWGYLPFFKLPFIHQTEIAYSMEARTGFPFYVVNDQQQLVEPPGTHRFREYFSLNVQFEKRFYFLGYYWAVRGGSDDITGHRNPLYVNNNVNSPQFLTYGAFQRRTFTSRIRLLGKKK